MREPEDLRESAFLAKLLFVGVLVAAFIVLIGGFLYLMHNYDSLPKYGGLNPEVPQLSSFIGIIQGIRLLQAQAIIQLGLFLLILVPVVRVLFSLIFFAWQKDLHYVIISAIVLIVLLFGLVDSQV